MGKGSCFLISETVNCARGIIGCAVCLVCAGPILIIVGIILLVAPNNRSANISKYNDAVNTWNGGSPGNNATAASLLRGNQFVMQHTNSSITAGTAHNTQLWQQTVSVDVSGNTDGVDAATSTYFYISPFGIQSDETYQFNMTARGVVANKTQNSFITAPLVPASVRQTNSVKCVQQYCSSKCSHSNFYCSRSQMRSDCNGNWNPNSGSCRSGDDCGTCQETKYLTKMCLVMDFSVNDGWSFDSTKQACKYPFNIDDQTYDSDTPTSSMTIHLYSNEDPYIQLQAILKGDKDFGLTKSQQKGLGLAALGIGGTITFVMVVIGFVVCTNRRHRERVGSYSQVARGGSGYQEVQPQQQYNPQPAAAYSTAGPQPGYPPQQQQQQQYAAQQPQQPGLYAAQQPTQHVQGGYSGYQAV